MDARDELILAVAKSWLGSLDIPFKDRRDLQAKIRAFLEERAREEKE